MRAAWGEIHRSLEGCDNWIFMSVMKAYQVFPLKTLSANHRVTLWIMAETPPCLH